MTAMLASVTSRWEARQAVSAGADIVDLKDPARGALGALPVTTVAEIVGAVGAERPTSATIGDLTWGPAAICEAVAAMSETGVDYVKVGLFSALPRIRVLEQLAATCAGNTRIVIVLFADQDPDLELLDVIAANGCVGVMLDTAAKNGRGLRSCLTHAELGRFVSKARALGLLTGLAGALRLEDVAPMLDLEPDYLGFRGALCRDGERVSSIDRDAVQAIRTLIDRHRLALPSNGSADPTAHREAPYAMLDLDGTYRKIGAVRT